MPPAVENSMGEGEGGESDELVTAMEAMEVGEEAMVEGDKVEVEEYNAEIEGVE